MGKNESFEFTDMGKYSSNSDVSTNKRGGCFVTIVTGFILTLLAACLAVGVGIIVHFAGGSKELECHYTFGSGSDGTSGAQQGGSGSGTTLGPGNAAIAQCINWAKNGNSDICKYLFNNN